MINILFRADSSSTIGVGHIMRDLVLAKQFQDSNIIFACQDLQGNLIDTIPYQVEILKSNSAKEIDKLIKKYDINMIIIDHYGINYNYEKQLKIKNPLLTIMVLDDTYEKHYCNILLNHNIYADANRYNNLVPKDCELRCGTEYTLLREEFYKEKAIKRDKIYDVLIAMGGADTQNLNIKLLKLLPKYFKIAVLTTKANKHLNKLKSYVKNKKNINLYINSTKIAKLINKSKFAIVTPSVTLNEVYFMGLPFLAIKTADNQEEMYHFLKRNNLSVLDKFDKGQFKMIFNQNGIK